MTDIELVKARVDIVSLIGEYISLKKAGRTFKALCPFHSEKTPSFVVSPERGTWHCFGACNEGGDVISFLQKWENLEFVEALKILAERAGVTLSQLPPSKTSTLKERLYAINHVASEFYRFLLTTHAMGAHARTYLETRGIKEQTIATFTLGYAPKSWRSLLLYLQKKGYKDEEILQTGLIVRGERGRLYDRFRGRVMFPLANHRGDIVGFAGRLLFDEQKEAKYVNTPETMLYRKGEHLYGLFQTKESIKKEKKAVVVEGEFDFLSSFQSGVSNVVAIKGSALTQDQVLLLRRYTEVVVLALDSDVAGSEASRRAIDIADAKGLTLSVVSLPVGKDPAECIAAGAHLWKKAVDAAVSIYDFILQTALKKYDKESVLGKRQIGDMVVPFFARIDNPIIQAHYVKQLALQLEVTEESIGSAIKKYEKKEMAQNIASPLPLPSIAPPVTLEEYLLSLVVQSPHIRQSVEHVDTILGETTFYDHPAQTILNALKDYIKTHETLNVQEFVALLPPEVLPTFDRAFLRDINSLLENTEAFMKELNKTAKVARRNAIRRSIKELSTKMKEEEHKGNEKEASQLQERLRSLLSQLQQLEKASHPSEGVRL